MTRPHCHRTWKEMRVANQPSSIPDIAPRLVTDQVYGYLESAILNGEIAGGSRLRVRQLAELVGTSVMPVREAISRLEDTGLAEREAHKGAVVKVFSVPELIKIYNVRLLLEPEAARLGAEHLTDEDLRQMSAYLDDLRRELDAQRVSEALAADTAFLRTLYRRSGNDVLCGMIDTLWKQSHLYRITVTDEDMKVGGNRTYGCDVGILESGSARDGDAAETWVRRALEKAIHALTHRDRAAPTETVS